MKKMNFSDSFSTNNRLCNFSPDGFYLAHVDGHYKLFVRSSKTLNIIHTFTCLDEISNMLWSYNSTMVLCAMCKRAVIQIFSVDNSDWTCKIDEGSYGLTSVHWSADDQSVLTTSEFNLRITVWSLVNKSVSYIKYPKVANPGLDFSGLPVCTFSIVLNRRSLKRSPTVEAAFRSVERLPWHGLDFA